MKRRTNTAQLPRLYGLDVFQGYEKINWGTVVAETEFKDFAIVRLSEASAGRDQRAVENVRGARAAGIPLIGGYMVPSRVPTPASSPKAEVALAQKQAAEGGGVDFMVIDFELPSTKSMQLDAALKKSVAQKLLDLIACFEDVRGETPVLYSYAPFLDFFGAAINDAARCPLWLAAYRKANQYYEPDSELPPTLPKMYEAVGREDVIWQWAADGSGTVKGLPRSLGGVDRNIAYYPDVDSLKTALGIKVVDMTKGNDQ